MRSGLELADLEALAEERQRAAVRPSSMIDRRLRAVILVFLWGALLEDTLLFAMAWLAPSLWFRVFHASVPAGLEVAFLRRSAGQWAAFALAQAIALWRWRQDPLWLVITAGVRFSDLFTDLSYILAVPSLTGFGWALLTPPPVLNLIGVVILVRGYRQSLQVQAARPA
jgi:hypothetical protein